MDWTWVWMPVSWLLLLAAAFAAYWNSFEGQLFFDDLSSVIGNPYVQVFVHPRFSEPGVKWTEDGLIRAFFADIDTPFAGRPIVSFTFALTHWWAFEQHPALIPEFYGVLQPHYKYYHFVNFGFHVAVGILLYQLLRRTFLAPNVREYTGRNADLWALAASLIWIVHPINTETVVYVTQRTEQVVSLFLLLTIYCGSLSITFRNRGVSLLFQCLAFFFCHLGMDSKENMVAAPLLMVLYDRAFYYSTWREALRSRWGFYLSLFVTYATLAGRNNANLFFGPRAPASTTHEAMAAATADAAQTTVQTVWTGMQIAKWVAKEFVKAAALMVPLLLFDRTAYFATWGETIRARWRYYLVASACLFLFGLILGTALPHEQLVDWHRKATDKLAVYTGGPGAFIWFGFYALFGLDFINVGILVLPLAALFALLVFPDQLLNYGSFKAAVAERGPYYASLVGLFLMVHTGVEMGPRGMSVGFGFERMDWLEYLITQCWCLARYLRITLIPTGLCVDYGRLPILDLISVVPGAVVVLSLLALTVWGWIRRPWVGFLGCWFFFILAPTSSFVPIVTEVGAERRMYLPVAAVLVAIGAAVGVLIRKLDAARGHRVSTERFAICLGGAIALLFGWVIYYYLIASQVDYMLPNQKPEEISWGYRDNEHIWQYYLLFPLGLCAATCTLLYLRQTSAPEDAGADAAPRRIGIVGTTLFCVGIQVVGLLFADVSFRRNNDYLTNTKLYGHIPKVFPWNERGCNNYAKICIDENRIEEAEGLLNQALKIDPEYSDAFTNRGIIFHRRKEMGRAIQNATEAIRWNPLNPSAWNNRGNAFIELKLFEKAVADFTQLVKMNPNGVEGYYGRANTYYLWGKLDEALADINNVIQRSPGDYKAYNTKGNILKQMGRHEEAVSAFSQGIHWLIAEAQSVKHPAIPAVEQCLRGDLANHAIALQFPNRPTLATILGNRADAYRNLFEKNPQGNAKQLMLDDLNRAIFMHPENLVYRIALGQQLFNLKMFPQALNVFNQVLQLQLQQQQQLNLDAIRGKILTLYEMKSWDQLWLIAKWLRDQGAPIDEPTLAKWREESGRDYPPDSVPGQSPAEGIMPQPGQMPPAAGVPAAPIPAATAQPGTVSQPGVGPQPGANLPPGLTPPSGVLPLQPSASPPQGGPVQQGPPQQGPAPQFGPLAPGQQGPAAP